MVFCVGIWYLRCDYRKGAHWTEQTEPIVIPLIAVGWPLVAFLLGIAAIGAAAEWGMEFLARAVRYRRPGHSPGSHT